MSRLDKVKELIVSTHSRLKAAGLGRLKLRVAIAVFQHTAA